MHAHAHSFMLCWPGAPAETLEVDRAQLGGWLDSRVNAESSSLCKCADDELSSSIAPVAPREGADWREDIWFW